MVDKSDLSLHECVSFLHKYIYEIQDFGIKSRIDVLPILTEIQILCDKVTAKIGLLEYSNWHARQKDRK